MTKKAPAALEAAYHAAWGEPVNRCDSRNTNNSAWLRMAKLLSLTAQVRDWKARCVKEAGHAGSHLGPDESVWPNQAEAECTPKE